MVKKIIIICILVICISVIANYFVYRIISNSNVEPVNSKEFKHYNNDAQYNLESITKIKEIDIQNENIKQQYQFAIITDSHISIEDENEPDEKIKEALEERRNLYVNLNMFKKPSELIFSDMLDYAQNRNVDSILMLGDIIDTPSNSNLSFLKKELDKLDIGFLYTLGNHDWTFSWNYQSKETAQKYKPKLLEIMEIAKNKFSYNTINEIFVDLEVSYLEYSDLVLLSIDNSTSQITETSIPKIEKALNKNKPTLVIMHVPVATDYIAKQAMEKRGKLYSIGDKGITPKESTKKALDLLLNNSNIFYIISGHTHFEIEDVVEGKIPEIVCSPAFESAMTLIKINN